MHVDCNRLTTGYYDLEDGTIIAANHCALAYNFQEFAEDPYFMNNPGFFACANTLLHGSGLPGGSSLGFNILSDLLFWNGGGAPTFGPVPDGGSLRFNLGNQNRLVATGTGAMPGFHLQNVAGGMFEGAIHRHLNSDLMGTVGANPADGIYAVQIELTTNAVLAEGPVAPSLPFWIVFNNGLSEDHRDEAVNGAHIRPVERSEGGDYHAAANWTGEIPPGDIVPHSIVPTGPGAIARFLDNICRESTVTIYVPVTIGGLRFDGPHSYTLTGSQTSPSTPRGKHKST